jgi:alpha-ketoglutarate-dependent taurine dioxygenase
MSAVNWRPLEPRCSPFGASLDVVGGHCVALLDLFEADAGASLRSQLGDSHGLLLLRGVPADEAQEVLLRLANLLGTPDDYGMLGAGSGRGNVLRLESGLPTEITTVTLSGNLSREEVIRPGTLTYPARYGYHTDQSFRSEPADITLFYCVSPAGDHIAPTAFADGVAAYASLPAHRREELQDVELLHAGALTGRWEPEVRGRVALAESSGGVDCTADCTTAFPSRRRRLVRRHPETGVNALYMCDGSQLDYQAGPVVAMEPGPDRAGHQLVAELMAHYTQPAHALEHNWKAGDLVVYDNRSVIHCGTWYDQARYPGRVMWRLTVSGNPGPREDWDGEVGRYGDDAKL